MHISYWAAAAAAHLVHLLHGAVEGDVAVLLVRVVEARARHVAHPDAEVLDGRRVLLEDLQPGQHIETARGDAHMQPQRR